MGLFRKDTETARHVGDVAPEAVDAVAEHEHVPEMVALVEKMIRYGRTRGLRELRGQILGDTDGFVKLVFSPDDQKLLGVSIVGEQACEMIHLAAAVMSFGGTIDYFIQGVFNYPALSDAFKYAAYDGLQALAKRRAKMPGLPSSGDQHPVRA